MTLFKSVFLISLCFLINLLDQASSQSSDNVWKRGAGTHKEYLVLRTSKDNFDEANANCEEESTKSRLPRIMTQQENDAVMSLIPLSSGFSASCVWLGAKKDDQLNDFVWLNEERQNYTNWRAKSLINRDHEGVTLWNDDGKWMTQNYENVRFIGNTVCERPYEASIDANDKAIKDLNEKFDSFVEMNNQRFADLEAKLASQKVDKSIENRLIAFDNKLATLANEYDSKSKTLKDDLERKLEESDGTTKTSVMNLESTINNKIHILDSKLDMVMVMLKNSRG